MSAIPEKAYRVIQIIKKLQIQTKKTNEFLETLVERTDDALLTDEEVYQLKGGDANFLVKTALGLGAAALFLIATKRTSELTRFNIRGKN